MLLPYASDTRPTRAPVFTICLMALMTVLTIVIRFSPSVEGHPSSLVQGFGVIPAHFHPLTLLSYSFLHDTWSHLILNLFFLWVFGGGVEAAVGPGKYFLLLVAGGAFGGALQAFVMASPFVQGVDGYVPIVGASAGIAGLIGLYAVRYYRSRLMFLGTSYRPHVVLVVLLFLCFEIGNGTWHLFIGAKENSIANWAHVGGFVFGLAIAHALRLGDAGRQAYLKADATKAMDRSEPGSAIQRWEMLLERDPNNAMARVELARAWLALGDTERAFNHYLSAIVTRLDQQHRTEAATVYAEMYESNLPSAKFTSPQMFVLGNTLAEQGQHAIAADVLRKITVSFPDTPEAETSLLRVIGLYVHSLNRYEEAKILLRLFLDRYPHSQWRGMAEELQRIALLGEGKNTRD